MSMCDPWSVAPLTFDSSIILSGRSMHICFSFWLKFEQWRFSLKNWWIFRVRVNSAAIEKTKYFRSCIFSCMSQKAELPSLTGHRTKTRKRDEKKVEENLKKFWVKIIFWIAGLRSIRLPRLCHWGSWTVKGRGGLRWVHGNHTLSYVVLTNVASSKMFCMNTNVFSKQRPRPTSMPSPSGWTSQATNLTTADTARSWQQID